MIPAKHQNERDRPQLHCPQQLYSCRKVIRNRDNPNSPEVGHEAKEMHSFERFQSGCNRAIHQISHVARGKDKKSQYSSK